MNSAEVLIKFKGDATDLDKTEKTVETSLGKLTKSFTVASLASKAISKGIQIFSSNLNEAVSRIDTMNNFSKVMKNLGISAKDSEEVINDLSNELIGLPTTLNSAASSVQRLTSYNGNIKKSEKYFLAMNNAIIAGTNDAGMQASAMEQLTQAYTKGKPDMQDWKILLQAMPAQLKQVAIALGYPQTDKLYEALKNGKVSMTDFMETMVKLDETGINGMASFSKQARDNTSGIGTSITNMKTAFVRGVADMVKQVDKSLEPFGGLSGVISNMGKVGEKAFKKLGKILSTVVTKLVEFGKWVVKNKQWLVPLIGAIATFVATFKTIQTVIAIINGVKTAMIALNATLMANPITLIVAGIAAVIAGLVLLYNKCEWFREFVDGWINGFKIMINGIAKFIKNIVNGIVNIIKEVVNIIKPIISSLINAIKGMISTGISVFKTIFITIPTWINNTIIKPVATFFGNMWDNFKNGASKAWNGIKSVFSTVASFFKNIFTNAWNGVKAVFSTGGKIFNGIKEGIVSAFKNIVNGIIKGINKVVAIPFKELNKVLDKIRNVSILGKKPFKGMIGTISVPKIPTLNVGTNYVPEDTLAMIHKGEAVIPKKFNPYTNMNSSMLGIMNNSGQKQVINVYASFKQDNLGQVVRDIKTFSGGARNDYNYGASI